MKRRLPKRWGAVLALLLIGIAFVCGVLLPTFLSKTPVLLILWVPAGIYVLAFAAMAVWTMKHLP
jgi:hypothetical protein